MFISVDLPAPFSPRSACTSPRRSSKSTWSLARMPGNSLVIPRISRTGAWEFTWYAILAGWPPGSVGRPRRDPVALRERRRHLERARDDLLLVAVHQGDVGLRHRGVDLADAHAAVLQVEEEVGAAGELPVGDLLDRLVDAVVDALDAAREHLLREAVLVHVDADPPDVRLVGRLQGAQPAAPRDLEQHLRALGDLVLCDGLALVGRDEVLRVADQDLRPGHRLLRAEAVAGDPDVDRRDLHASDRADDLLAHPRRHLRGEHADEAPGLV